MLGSLLEKELTVPQQYPLTLHALLAACNQTSNREPVMQLREPELLEALDRLKTKGAVRFVYPSHGRSVTRYRQVLDELLGLAEPERALVGMLLLRGPQTAGELRLRTERMVTFGSVGEVQATLDGLAARAEPVVSRLPRQPGQKEERFCELLSDAALVQRDGHPTPGEWGPTGALESRVAAPSGAGAKNRTGEADPSALSPGEVARLRQEVAELRDEVGRLRQELAALQQALGSAEDPPASSAG